MQRNSTICGLDDGKEGESLAHSMVGHEAEVAVRRAGLKIAFPRAF